jgi:hypothetical protein
MLIPQSFDISQPYLPLGDICSQVTLIADISRHPHANTLNLRLISIHLPIANRNRYTEPRICTGM